MNHLTEEQFVLYYYGEGDDSPAVRGHLDACESCRAEYANLQRVLNVVDSAPVPERDADYGAQVWNRLKLWDRPPGLSSGRSAPSACVQRRPITTRRRRYCAAGATEQ